MCLIKTHRFPKYTHKDIIVYKRLKSVHGEWYTPYQCVNIKLNSLIYNHNLILYGVFTDTIEGCGVHSYEEPRVSLFKSIIPKGSWYYIGNDGDIASNKLYVTNEQVCAIPNGKVVTKKILV